MKIAFLTYLNRSGSTYLASKLAKFDAICVGIEGRFKYDWITTGCNIEDEQALSSYLDDLYMDTKFRSWQVDRNTLESELLKYPFPLKFSNILLESLLLYCNPSENKLIIHKCGEYYLCVEEIRKELPEAKFIFIERDPRAIFNSQKRSLDSRTGLPMQTDILHFIFSYLHTRKVLASSADDSGFLKVRYEDLVRNEQDVIDNIVSFLGVAPVLRGGDAADYFNDVPAGQKHLHQNVSEGKPIATRLMGWQNELSGAEILLLQDVLRTQLLADGYELYHLPKVAPSQRARYAKFRLLYTYERLKRRMFGIEHSY